MNDINRLLIFLLLIGLLYVIYKYQHLIFNKDRLNSFENLISIDGSGPEKNNLNQNQNPIQEKDKNKEEDQHQSSKQKKVSIDNISQLSINSLEDEDGEREPIYKPDSILGSLDDNSLFISEDGTNRSLVSDASSFFF